MNKIFFLTTSILAAFVFWGGHADAGTKIWGLDNISKVSAAYSAPYTVYIGSYTSQENAQKVQSKLQKEGYSAQIYRERNFYMVSIGPFATFHDLHRFATKSKNQQQMEQIPQSFEHSVKKETKNEKTCKDCTLQHNHWFAQLQGGVVFPLSEHNLLVDNGSNFAAPANVDTYFVKQSNQGTIALTLGKRIATQSSLINHFTLSGRLQYVFPMDVGNSIMQYSLPEFLNYTYNWKLSTLALTSDTKVSLFHFSRVSPYVNGGLGLSFNQASSFNESAFPGVTPRISPSFSNHTSTQFAYHTGVGLDFLVTPNCLLSAGYEFESFGDFSSGKGQTTWSGESLQLGTFETNTLLFGVSYLIA